MERFVRLVLPVGLMAVLGSTAACATSEPAGQLQWNQVPISDFGSVAGKWEGLMTRAPRAQNDDWVKVAIHEDGQYEFASYRMIGVFHGRGTLSLADGKMTSSSERGTVTCTLYTADGQRMLRAVGITKGGLEHTVDLEPVKQKN